MVLIPLLSLFLITTQISIVIQGRNIERMNAQDISSREALDGKFSSEDSFVHIGSPDPTQNLDLVITRKRKPVITIFPGLPEVIGGEPLTDVSGIAVVENRR